MEYLHPNILKGTDGLTKTMTHSWDYLNLRYDAIEFGATYALSFDCDSTAAAKITARFNYITTDGKFLPLTAYQKADLAAGGNHVVMTLQVPDEPADLKSSYLMIQASNLADGVLLTVSRPMLVKGTEAAAWAPADGETLAGGGCSHER